MTAAGVTGPQRTRNAIARSFTGWRTWPARVLRMWRRSLQFRTVVITLGLSSLAMLGTGFFVSQSVASDLYATRVQQVLVESSNATSYVQSAFDAASSSEDAALGELMTSSLDQLARLVPSAELRIGLLRTPGQPGPAVVQGATRLPDDVVSDELRTLVATGPAPQYYQATTVDAGGTPAPGIVVGSRLTLAQAGRYELYTVFDLSEEQATLAYVQRTLLLGGLALILLIGGVAWVIVRLVVRPIRVTAETSRRLADGELEVRMHQNGEDEIAVLARSFNDMADSLQEQITRLADLSQVQQRFVSDVSHELRTPLTTIQLAGDVLYDRRESFTPEAARAAELLHAQVGRLSDMLSDLLEISRHDAGAVDADFEPVQFARLVEDVVDNSRPIAAGMGSDLELVVLGGAITAEVDARRVRRIVRNLLDNAIEHGEAKPIRVTVDSNQSAVAVAVRDHGIGISEQNQSRVFDRFWRADPSRQRTLGGTGLGLAISLEDTQLHGGWLQLWSQPGEGTQFLLTLPRTRGGPITASPLPAVPDDAPPQQAEPPRTHRRSKAGRS